MKLENKKGLASRALKVGKNRVVFNKEMLPEIKEAITKQDIIDLKLQGAIMVKEVKGRRTIKRRKTRRRPGSVKIKVKKTKEKYMAITRKLRSYLMSLKKQGKISPENFRNLRKEIRSGNFKSLSNMKERIKEQ